MMGAMPKWAVFENKAGNNYTSTLNMACVGTCVCDRTPFMVKPANITFYKFDIMLSPITTHNIVLVTFHPPS